MQVKKNIYLTFKEAINNAVKYSEAKNIFLSVKNEKDFINLEIRDDGKGFDKHTCQQGNGLSNMQARANDLQANFNIDSRPGKGTAVRLRFLFHPAGGQEPAINFVSL
jgi:signal transduction histidine kinase